MRWLINPAFACTSALIANKCVDRFCSSPTMPEAAMLVLKELYMLTSAVALEGPC